MSSGGGDSPKAGGDDVEVATRALAARAALGGLRVIVVSGAAKGTELALGTTLRVGKAPDNDLVLPDDTVSRHHCVLTQKAEGVEVRDLDSTNGTKVQGARVTAAVVAAGTVLKVGEVEVLLRPASRAAEVMPSDRTSFGAAIGRSLAMRTVFGVLERIAPTDATVLLEGETGVGKDVLARAICAESPRASKPFVVVDCGAVSYSLIESELFGHERGAFTGAVASRHGAFELADGGTVFLDEIGDLPLDVQPKLLRVLETRELRRVGGNRTIKIDVRVIAATKRNLKREVEGGKFREDLFFRLAVVPVLVPPLRARRDDVPALVEHILAASGGAGTGLTVSPDVIQSLAAHDWPGNVRELRNVLERSVYLAKAVGQTRLDAVSLASATPRDSADAAPFEPGQSYRDTRARFEADFERRYVKWLLTRHGGNVSAAARDAKMDRKHLYDMAKKHGLRGTEAEDSD
jgi:transcriptional regulator with GAF, ATPase, and Fis domain